MKKTYVKDLAVGMQVRSHFFVVDRRLINYTRGGAPACGLVLSLADKTGRAQAVAWNEALVADSTYRKDDVVLVTGKVQDYKGEKQIYIEDIAKACPSEVNAEDFCAPPPRPIAGMWQELEAHMATIGNHFLKTLLEACFAEPGQHYAFCQAPAGREVHHAYVGGLLHHTLEVVQYALRMVEVQGTYLNRDLLLAGAVLHDISKVEEYEPRAFAFEFTDRGRLLGHVVLGAEKVGRLADGIPGFPRVLRDELQHMILSHHGHREWGSPEEPKTVNAVALHLADLTSGKINQVEKIITETISLGERWSAWDKRLESSILVANLGG
ncbi:MAG: 3'-5' exoribonuclease YhaM [Firmicutes bacterium]|nr:3'-5' exoribonuclease YhaM [Bacillota bacterium]